MNKSIYNEPDVRQRLLSGVVLIFLGILLYSPAVYFEFIIYDDPDYITLNRHVLNGLTWDGIKWAFFNIHGEKTYWHPVTWLSHMLDCELFGANASAHHFMNVLFAIINSLLVFYFIGKLTGSTGKSFAVAFLFLCHPIQVETVAWISERKNVLTTFFAVLCLIFYLKYAVSLKARHYLFALLFLALCFMCKPALVPLPFLMLLLDIYPMQRVILKNQSAPPLPSRYKIVTLKRAILEKIPMFLLSAGICVITIEAHKVLSSLALTMPLLWRTGNALVSIGSYLQKTIVPLGFAVFYPHPGKWDSDVVLRSALLLCFVTVLLILYRKRNGLPLIGWLWFLGMLIPASGIIQAGMQSMAMRFLYFPVIGIFIAYVWIVADILSKFRYAAFLKKFVFIVVGLYCYGFSSKQLLVWQDSLTLFEQALKNTKNNFIAHCNYGLALYYRGNYSLAKEHFLDAIRIYPKFIEARLNLGMVLEKENDVAGAYEQYKTVTGLRQDIPFAWKSLARAAGQLGRNEEALNAVLKAIELNPDSDAELYFMAGFLSAVTLKPADAIKYYKKSLELNPLQPVVLNNLAWLLATLPEDNLRDGKEAVSLAKKANELTGSKNVIINGTLAAAYAEAGDFDNAVATARRAIELAISLNEKEFEKKNRDLLNLYLNKKPYREPLDFESKR